MLDLRKEQLLAAVIPPEFLRKIRRIQIRSSHKVNELLAGSWHSAFKGQGIEFEEVRPHQAGDDVHSIDWNVTARSDRPFIKLFREEREMTVILLVDLSLSQNFGSSTQSKRELVSELGATLALSAIKNNDRVGLTLFTSDVEKSVPPGKGSTHVLRLIRDLLYCDPVGTGTDLRQALEHVNRTRKRRSVVFLISDFQDSDFEAMLKVARRRHDIIPIVVSDPRETEIPNVGLVRLQDAETGEVVMLDTARGKNRDLYRQLGLQKAENRDAALRRLEMEPIHVVTGEDFIKPLRRYFDAREGRK